jgi:hypothetical protein
MGGDGRTFDARMHLYAVDRLMARVSEIPAVDGFGLIAKGAYITRTFAEPGLRRTTRDVDLAAGPGVGPEAIMSVFRAAASLDRPGDGIIFKPALATQTPIRKALSGGVRILMPAAIGSMQVRAQVDVALGMPRPLAVSRRAIPAIIHGQCPAILDAVLPEHILAEKTAATIRHCNATSRLKDFVDFHILTAVPLDGVRLQASMRDAFENDRIRLPDCRPAVLDRPFAEDPARRSAFAAIRDGLPDPSRLPDMADIVDRTWACIAPMIAATREGRPFIGRWDPRLLAWGSVADAEG